MEITMRRTSKKSAEARSACWVTIGLLVSITPKALAQNPSQEPATILEILVQNAVTYLDDVSDPSKLASSPGIAPPIVSRSFMPFIYIGDIVSVNGKPAKGSAVGRGTNIALTTSPNPGQAIADVIRGGTQDNRWEIQQADGTPVGTIMTSGFSGGAPPLGAPTRVAAGNNAILGGTGAFMGVQGQWGSVSSSQRGASMSEDPANRRANGGGANLFVLQLIPMRRPEIATTSTGPAVFHADFSPVTAAKPAKAGEVLIVRATGLGPTVPGVDPGQLFPTDAPPQVNSPVEMTVNGQSAEVINKIGWPGKVDTYRLDFRVPDGTTAGMAAIQLTAAWIPGTSVNIPIQ
jgi:hypothetical protein